MFEEKKKKKEIQLLASNYSPALIAISSGLLLMGFIEELTTRVYPMPPRAFTEELHQRLGKRLVAMADELELFTARATGKQARFSRAQAPFQPPLGRPQGCARRHHTDQVPVLVWVQDLQKRLLADKEGFAPAWNWVDAYLIALYGMHSEIYRFQR